MSDNPVLDMRTCMVIDAKYTPYVGDDDDLEVYDNAVVLLLQDVETYNIYHCPMTPEDIQRRAGISRELRPRELIAFVEALRNRESPVQLLVATDTNLVTPELLDALEQKGMLKDNASKAKYEKAKKDREQFEHEERMRLDEEYQRFAQERNNKLLKEFEEWKHAQQEQSKINPLLYMDDIADMPNKEESSPKRHNIKDSNIGSPKKKNDRRSTEN